jgi:hypothetical protein
MNSLKVPTSFTCVERKVFNQNMIPELIQVFVRKTFGSFVVFVQLQLFFETFIEGFFLKFVFLIKTTQS